MGPARARRRRESAWRQMETTQHLKDGQGKTSAGGSQAERLSGCVIRYTPYEKERPLSGAQTCNAVAGGVDDYLSYMIECSDTPTFIRAIANKCQLLPPHRAPWPRQALSEFRLHATGRRALALDPL